MTDIKKPNSVSLGIARIMMGGGETRAIYSNRVSDHRTWPSNHGFEPREVKLGLGVKDVKLLRAVHEESGAVYALIAPALGGEDHTWELRGGAPLLGPGGRLRLDVANDARHPQQVVGVVFGEMLPLPRDPAAVASEHGADLTSGRLPPEDVASNIAEDIRRAERG